jgi:hypothetical protein
MTSSPEGAGACGAQVRMEERRLHVDIITTKD